MNGSDRFNPRVMVIDDIDVDRITIISSLRADNYDLIEVSDIETAIELALKDCPDLILLNICLPRHEALTFSRFIRSNECLRDIPIIAIANTDDLPLRAVAASVGCNQFIVTPVESEHLRQSIDSLLHLAA